MDQREAIKQLPEPQAQALMLLAIFNPGSTWHFNDCGCCVCLHPGGDKHKGYIINSDGDYDYIESSHNGEE